MRDQYVAAADDGERNDVLEEAARKTMDALLTGTFARPTSVAESTARISVLRFTGESAKFADVASARRDVETTATTTRRTAAEARFPTLGP